MTPKPIGDARRMSELLDAVLVIGSDLSLPAVLRRIAESAIDLLDAQYGALGVLDEERLGLAQFVHVGMDDEKALAIGHLPEGHGILGLLIVEPEPIRLPNLSAHPDSYGFPPHHPPMNSFLGVPITIRGQVFGNLYLTEKRGADEFSAEDEAVAVALASAAAIAIENARLHARSRETARIEDRERIAADLHDKVIQRLFGAGLALGALVPQVPGEAGDRIEQIVGDLDETIRDIRSTIFALTARASGPQGLRQRILSVSAEAAASLGFDPHVRLDGAIEAEATDEMAEHLVAALREMLANVARHARARSVGIEVSVRDGLMTVIVVDDGDGPPDELNWGRGLANLKERAQQLGGTFELSTDALGRGCRAVWVAALK